MSDRIPAHAIEGLSTGSLNDFDTATPPVGGDVPVWDDALGKYVPGATAATPTSVLVPLTTAVGGVPQLVWDENDNLVMTEVPA